MPTDWQELSLARTAPPAVVDPRRRLRCCLGAFVLLLIVVWCRAVQLEISQGAAFREEALRPNRREKTLPAARGRILARDGTRAGLRSGSGGRGRRSIATWKNRRGRPGWNNWPASGCRKISVAMRPGWPRKCRSCGKSATTCTAAWLRCAASIFPSGRPGHASAEPRRADRGRRPAAADRSRPIGPAAARRCVVGRSLLRGLARDLRARPRRRAGDRHRGRRTGRPCPGGRHSRGGGCGNPAARRTLSRHADRSPDPSDLSCGRFGGARARVSRAA